MKTSPEPLSKLPAPYYEADGITLYHGDMREIVPLLGRRFDAVVTDPPYNETSLEWDVWPLGWPVLIAGVTDSLWCFGSFRMFWDRVPEFADWKLSQDVIWEKQNGSGLANDRFKRVHELAIHLYRGEWGALYKNPPIISVGEERRRGSLRRKLKPAHFGDVSNAEYEYGGTRIMRSVMQINNCHGYAVNETQKPEGIVAPLLKYSVPAGGSVLDCFAGSGTVLAEARRQGKQAVGIESRESQCREIVARLAQSELSLA
jgi:site-specific DNA-methyltransferase (adenine-specific)